MAKDQAAVSYKLVSYMRVLTVPALNLLTHKTCYFDCAFVHSVLKGSQIGLVP